MTIQKLTTSLTTASVLSALVLLTAAQQGQAAAAGSFGAIPLTFEPNQGQSVSDSEFLVRRGSYTMFFRQNEAVLALHAPNGGSTAGQGTVRFTWLDAATPQITGEARTGGVSNYLHGRDRSAWKQNIPHFSRVRYRNLYPGVDLVYYGKDGLLEYDLIVAPGADTSRIRFKVTGGKSVDMVGSDIVVHTAQGDLVQKAPVVYQEIAGVRKVIDSRYRWSENGELAFQLGAYDRSRELIIDPIISYGRLFGGSAVDQAEAIAVDSTGATYIAGQTFSSDLPAVNQAFGYSGSYEAFVMKLNPAGSAIVYTTYLGGSSNDGAHGIAVDSTGAAYITGQTSSADYPAYSPLTTFLNGSTDAFVTKLDPGGSTVSYSGLIGGSSTDIGWGIAVDASSNAYIVGQTTSLLLPSNLGSSNRSGTQDAFIARIAASDKSVGTRFIGGSTSETAYGVAIKGSYVYVAGTSNSTNLTSAGVQASNGGGYDAFLQKANLSDLSQVAFTYFGGAANETARGIAIDGMNNVYVAGYVSGTGMPTSSPLQGTFGGTTDGFIFATDTNLSTLKVATYLGGAGDDQILGIAIDPNNSVFVTGYTASADFPAVNNLRTGTLGLSTDAFLTKYSPMLGSYLFSTYLGGGNTDKAYSVAADNTGAYIAGLTLSSDFQNVTGTLQDQDAFIMKLTSTCNFSFSPNPINFTSTGGQQTVTVTVGGECGWTATTTDSFLTIGTPQYGASNGSFTVTASSNGSGQARTGSISIGSTTITVNQASACTYGLSATSNTVSAATPTTTSVTVTPSTGSCGWTAQSNVSWITVTSGASGTGTGSVGYRVGINPLPSQRVGTLTIAGITYTVTQSARIRNAQSIATYNNGAWRQDVARAFVQNSSNYVFAWGVSGWTAVAGDWNGDGTTKVGVFKDGVWILDMNNSRTLDAGDRIFQWGNAGMTPVVGDWNGDGTSKVGVFQNGNWYIDINGDRQLNNGEAFAWGPTNGIAMVGDWNGDGKTKVGSYSPTTGAWILDTNGDYVYQPLSDFLFQWGSAGFTPLVGDFFGLGRDTVGAYLSGRFWLEDGDGFSNAGDVNFTFISNSTGTPIVGDWTYNGKAKVGIQTGNQMTIDYDGDRVFNIANDKQFTFGNSGDTVVIGRWQ